MRITDISISMEALENLGDYTNTRPKVELRAALDPTDNVNTAIAQLTMTAQRTLREIIDDEREAHELTPRYSTEPLYAILEFNGRDTVALVPRGAVRELKETGQWWANGRNRFYRLARAEFVFGERMRELPSDWISFDCADGDISPLVNHLKTRDAERERQKQGTAQSGDNDPYPGEFDDDDDPDDDEDDEIKF